MKHFFKSILAFCFAAIMACAIIPAASAQEDLPEETEVTSILSAQDDDVKAYDLVWRFKESGGHLYKRRWNKTLNKWYDPAWILVQ